MESSQLDLIEISVADPGKSEKKSLPGANKDNGCQDEAKYQLDPSETQGETKEQHGNNRKSQMIYSVDDIPPWHWSFLLGFQHYLTMIGGTIAFPLIIVPAMCVEEDDPVKSSIVSTIVFISGMVTMLQTTFGIRLPIVQGGTPSFLVPTFAILSLPEWQCSAKELMSNMTYEDKTELWQTRMREIQGAIIVASIFQVVLGLTGAFGLILRFITPLTIAPAITMVGISMFLVAGEMAGKHWGVSGMTICLVVFFSLYLRNIKCPLPSYRRGEGWKIVHFNLFALLPIMMSIILVWTVCSILTISGVLEQGSPARTDTKIRVLYEAPWFRVPYPCQWGWPTVSPAGVFGMLAGVIASIIESIGDYYACARLSGARPPPVHAINRGVAVEGIGCILAGLWGSGNGTTSYSENIGAVGITKVGSRRVIQCAAGFLLFFGVFSKFGALLVSIPEPVIGGIFCVMFGMITATGLSNLQFIDMNSSRNLLIFGFSIFFSLVLSQWMSAHPGVINTGSLIIDQIFTVLLTTTMFTAGIMGFFLDNTVPGTPEERGINWLDLAHQQVEDHHRKDHQTIHDTYDIPFITPWLKSQSWSSFMPFLPTYKFHKCRTCSCCKKMDDKD